MGVCGLGLETGFNTLGKKTVPSRLSPLLLECTPRQHFSFHPQKTHLSFSPRPCTAQGARVRTCARDGVRAVIQAERRHSSVSVGTWHSHFFRRVRATYDDPRRWQVSDKNLLHFDAGVVHSLRPSLPKLQRTVVDWKVVHGHSGNGSEQKHRTRHRKGESGAGVGVVETRHTAARGSDPPFTGRARAVSYAPQTVSRDIVDAVLALRRWTTWPELGLQRVREEQTMPRLQKVCLALSVTIVSA